MYSDKHILDEMVMFLIRIGIITTLIVLGAMGQAYWF